MLLARLLLPTAAHAKDQPKRRQTTAVQHVIGHQAHGTPPHHYYQLSFSDKPGKISWQTSNHIPLQLLHAGVRCCPSCNHWQATWCCTMPQLLLMLSAACG
jgi:hypothetical protein